MTSPRLPLYLFDCYLADCSGFFFQSRSHKLTVCVTFRLERQSCVLASRQDRKCVSPLTRGCNSVLPGGLVGAQGEQQGLDGSDEDPRQAPVEDDIEHYNFDCSGERKSNVSVQLYS